MSPQGSGWFGGSSVESWQKNEDNVVKALHLTRWRTSQTPCILLEHLFIWRPPDRAHLGGFALHHNRGYELYTPANISGVSYGRSNHSKRCGENAKQGCDWSFLMSLGVTSTFYENGRWFVSLLNGILTIKQNQKEGLSHSSSHKRCCYLPWKCVVFVVYRPKTWILDDCCSFCCLRKDRFSDGGPFVPI